MTKKADRISKIVFSIIFVLLISVVAIQGIVSGGRFADAAGLYNYALLLNNDLNCDYELAAGKANVMILPYAQWQGLGTSASLFRETLFVRSMADPETEELPYNSAGTATLYVIIEPTLGSNQPSFTVKLTQTIVNLNADDPEADPRYGPSTATGASTEQWINGTPNANTSANCYTLRYGESVASANNVFKMDDGNGGEDTFYLYLQAKAQVRFFSSAETNGIAKVYGATDGSGNLIDYKTILEQTDGTADLFLSSFMYINSDGNAPMYGSNPTVSQVTSEYSLTGLSYDVGDFRLSAKWIDAPVGGEGSSAYKVIDSKKYPFKLLAYVGSEISMLIGFDLSAISNNHLIGREETVNGNNVTVKYPVLNIMPRPMSISLSDGKSADGFFYVTDHKTYKKDNAEFTEYLMLDDSYFGGQQGAYTYLYSTDMTKTIDSSGNLVADSGFVQADYQRLQRTSSEFEGSSGTGVFAGDYIKMYFQNPDTTDPDTGTTVTGTKISSISKKMTDNSVVFAAGTGYYMDLILSLNVSSYDVLLNYKPVLSGNAELYSEGFTDSTDELTWLTDNEDTKEGIYLLYKNGPKETVQKARELDVDVSAELGDFEAYLTLSAEQKTAIFAAFYPTLNVDNAVSSLNDACIGKVMSYYYGPGYKAAQTVAVDFGDQIRYYIGTQFYGYGVDCVYINPPVLDLLPRHYYEIDSSATTDAERYSDGSLVEQYGYAYSDIEYDVMELEYEDGESIENPLIKFFESHLLNKLYFNHTNLSSIDMNGLFIVSMYRGSEAGYSSNEISIEPVLCRAFDVALGDSQYTFGLGPNPSANDPSSNRYFISVEDLYLSNPNKTIPVGYYYVCVKVYYGGVEIDRQCAEKMPGVYQWVFKTGPIDVVFSPTNFEITKKPIEINFTEEEIRNLINVEKEYDGTVTAFSKEDPDTEGFTFEYTYTYTENNVSHQGVKVTQKYPSLYNALNQQIVESEREYLEILIRPVFANGSRYSDEEPVGPNADADTEKDIVISLEVMLRGDDSYSYLKNNYDISQEKTYAKIGTITKKDVMYSFNSMEKTSSPRDEVERLYRLENVVADDLTNDQITAINNMTKALIDFYTVDTNVFDDFAKAIYGSMLGVSRPSSLTSTVASAIKNAVLDSYLGLCTYAEAAEAIYRAVSANNGALSGSETSVIASHESLVAAFATLVGRNVIFEMNFGSGTFNANSQRSLLFGNYVTEYDNGKWTIATEPEYRWVEKGIDFFGNPIYVKELTGRKDAAGETAMVPKLNNDNPYGFVVGEDPYDVNNIPGGFEWNNILDLSFYAVVDDGSLTLTNFSYNGVTNSLDIQYVDENSEGASLISTIDENTPPTGENPGVRVRMNGEISTDNYNFISYNLFDDNGAVFTRGLLNYAYLRILKKIPVFELDHAQESTYNTKSNSNMTKDLAENEEQYCQHLNINLAEHGDATEILGTASEYGLGVQVNIIGYCAPTSDTDSSDPNGGLTPIYYNENTIFTESLMRSLEYIAEHPALYPVALSHSLNDNVIKYAGGYLLEVWLPETKNYKQSERVIVLLKVRRASISVWSTNAEKNYADDNPPVDTVDQIGDVTDPTTWGYAEILQETTADSYLATVVYYMPYAETIEDIRAGFPFDFSSIDYLGIDTKTPIGDHPISLMSKNGVANSLGGTYNYVFEHRSDKQGFLTVKPVRYDIIIPVDPATDDYIRYEYPEDEDTEDIRIVETDYNFELGPRNFYPIDSTDAPTDEVKVFNYYNPNLTETVFSTVVGYINLENWNKNGRTAQYYLSYFSQRILESNENGETVYTPISELVFNPHPEGCDDLTPTEDFAIASNSGYYFIMLSSTGNGCVNHLEPYAKYIILKIDQADTILLVHDDPYVSYYTGSSYTIQETSVLEADGSLAPTAAFYTNNRAATKYITVYSGTGFEGEKPYAELSNREMIFGTTVLPDDEYEFENNMDMSVIDVGFYLVKITLIYSDEVLIRNYKLDSEHNYLYIAIEIKPADLQISFDSEEGGEQWIYSGNPFPILESTEENIRFRGMSYHTEPEAMPLSNITLRIYYVKDRDAVTLPFTFTSEGGLQLSPQETNIVEMVDKSLAVNAGSYIYVIKASSGGNRNYNDSLPVAQFYTIQQAPIDAYPAGTFINGVDGEKYPMSKLYLEELLKDRYTVEYEGFVNGEDMDSASGFIPAEIDWGSGENEVSTTANAREYDLTTIGGSADNYYIRRNIVKFNIYKAEAALIINPLYTAMTYTGEDHGKLPTFKANRASYVGEESMPFAFSLNHDPAGSDFSISVVGRYVDDSLESYDESVKSCIDAGVYKLLITTKGTTNYLPLADTYANYTITKAMLEATIGDAEMIYGSRYPTFEVTYTGFVGRDITTEDLAAGYTAKYKVSPYSSVSAEVIDGMQLPLTVTNFIHPAIVIPVDAIDVRSGGYVITLMGGESANYTVNSAREGLSSVLTINRRSIRVVNGPSLIKKQYDKTRYASGSDYPNVVRKDVHYILDGVIRHQLKTYANETDIDSVEIRFNAMFATALVGRQTVYLSEIFIDGNGNYVLENFELECPGEITKCDPVIQFPSTRGIRFDGGQKPLVPSVTGVGNEPIAYIIEYQSAVYARTEDAPRNAGEYVAIVTTMDDNYTTKILEKTFTIEKADVVIKFGGDVMQTYGSVTGLTALVTGINGFSVPVEVTYSSDENAAGNIAKANAGEYTATANFTGHVNYNAKRSTETFRIGAVEVNTVYSGATEFVYDGTGKTRMASFVDVDGNTMSASIRYYNEATGITNTEKPRDVGYYVTTAVTPSVNYILVGDLTSGFTISPRSATIGLYDLTIKEGEAPGFVYNNQGMAVGESQTTLDVPPVISYFDNDLQQFVVGVPTKVGVYRIIPTNASDKNYIITYTESTMTVNSSKVIINTSTDSGLIIEGSFSPDSAITVNVVQNSQYSTSNTIYDLFKQQNEEFKNTELSEIFEVDSSKATTTDKITIRVKMEGAEDGTTYRIALMRTDGSVEIVNAEIHDGYLVFEADQLSNFGIVSDIEQKKTSPWMYVAIAAGVLIILLALIFIKKRA